MHAPGAKSPTGKATTNTTTFDATAKAIASGLSQHSLLHGLTAGSAYKPHAAHAYVLRLLPGR